MPSDSASYGQAGRNTAAGHYNELLFVIQQQIGKLATSMPVKVVAQRGGGLDVVGYVDVTPMVQQLTGNGQPIDHGTITNVPYFRLQGGANAVIIDPSIGDIGIACFSSRDISSVKRSRKKAPPGSRRQYDFSDAMYIGGILSAAPTQYIQFSSGGITIHSPTKITLEAPITEVTGQLVMTGASGTGATMKGGVTNTGGTISSNGIVLESHVHSGVQSGSSETGGPV